MDAYSLWVGYGFLFVLAVFFTAFIHYALSGPDEEVRITPEKPVLEKTGTATLSGGLLSLLNFIQYATISLILLYITIIVLIIF